MDKLEITNIRATGKAVENLVAQMEPTFQDADPTVVLLACLSIVIILQHPDITPEQLAYGINDASQHIALWLSSLDQETIPKEQLN